MTAKPDQITLRPATEIQRAHDILAACIDHDAFLGLVYRREQEPLICAALDALCWALGHDHNTTFALNLDAIEKKLAGLGVGFVDLGRLYYRRMHQQHRRRERRTEDATTQTELRRKDRRRVRRPFAG